MRQLFVADHWGKAAQLIQWMALRGELGNVCRYGLAEYLKIRMNAIEAEIERQEMAERREGR